MCVEMFPLLVGELGLVTCWNKFFLPTVCRHPYRETVLGGLFYVFPGHASHKGIAVTQFTASLLDWGGVGRASIMGPGLASLQGERATSYKTYSKTQAECGVKKVEKVPAWL